MNKNSKDKQLDQHREDSQKEALTTNHGVKISDTDNSLKAGERGPTIMEDFHFREKMMHFDHERIPERVVHARGSGAHGYFQCYKNFKDITKAKFLQDPDVKTPVFVRFSTVVGFRGSADTVRDVRGFATKFYTEDGNYDLVANNMPVFFIQDGIKFPDLVHAIKPEPDHEMPQASAAHDTFWDFISLMPESAHMIMWVLSDRALPRSYATMDGFGVHTFRFVNEAGDGQFVKFHWRPINGLRSLVWDETQKIAGKDPDFNRRDLWERIEDGSPVEYELCVQLVKEEDAEKFDFDLLDPTKIIPEEDVPLTPLGKMVLDRNPDNFFAETEQVAFHPGHVVPGIDFTNDPLLQARLFSYLDTQLIRLGGPNFSEIPINRPTAPVHNNQRDGFMRQTINKGKTHYSPNSLGGGCPFTASPGAFTHYTEKVSGTKIRKRSESFQDHFSQATLFWNSLSEPEKMRLIEAGRFELGKVKDKTVSQRIVDQIFNPIENRLAVAVAEGIGAKPPKPVGKNHGRVSPTLSLDFRKTKSVQGMKVAVLAMNGFSDEKYQEIEKSLNAAGAKMNIISKSGAPLKTDSGREVEVDKTFSTTAPVLFDALFIPGGAQSVDSLSEMDESAEFIFETYRHYKLIAAVEEGVDLLRRYGFSEELLNGPGMLLLEEGRELHDMSFEERFVHLLNEYRFWDRPVFSRWRSDAFSRRTDTPGTHPTM